MSHAPAPVPPPLPITSEGLILPYATPLALDQGATTWRDGPVLIVPREASLPDLCVKCNAPAEGWRLRKTLAWHSPWLILLLLINLLVYAIVALACQKRATVELGLCPVHRASRWRNLVIAWSAFIVGLALLVGGVIWNFNAPYGEERPFALITIGVIILIADAIFALVATRPMRPKRIDQRFAWLKGAGPDFLANSPAVPR